MYFKRYNAFLALLFFILSCNNKNNKSDPVWSDLPEVTRLESLQQTDFAMTLESPVKKDKNIIYAPALLFAWDKLKSVLKSPIILTDSNSPELRILNNSISHRKSLTDVEFTTEAKEVDGSIIVRSFFNKTLPFQTKMQADGPPINFNKTKVRAFGMYTFNEEIVNAASVLYYADDDHFILKLVPKDNRHEIILVKGLEGHNTLEDALKFTNKSIEKGKLLMKNALDKWKYEISEKDIFSIPVIRFNLATNYQSIEAQTFTTKDNKDHFISEAYQRTGFILDENGAVVESEAMLAVDSVAANPGRALPKKMIFDKPFLIILKRADQQNPYFVMKVANAELLTKE